MRLITGWLQQHQVLSMPQSVDHQCFRNGNTEHVSLGAPHDCAGRVGCLDLLLQAASSVQPVSGWERIPEEIPAHWQEIPQGCNVFPKFIIEQFWKTESNMIPIHWQWQENNIIRNNSLMHANFLFLFLSPSVALARSLCVIHNAEIHNAVMGVSVSMYTYTISYWPGSFQTLFTITIIVNIIKMLHTKYFIQKFVPYEALRCPESGHGLECKEYICQRVRY